MADKQKTLNIFAKKKKKNVVMLPVIMRVTIFSATDMSNNSNL